MSRCRPHRADSRRFGAQVLVLVRVCAVIERVGLGHHVRVAVARRARCVIELFRVVKGAMSAKYHSLRRWLLLSCRVRWTVQGRSWQVIVHLLFGRISLSPRYSRPSAGSCLHLAMLMTQAGCRCREPRSCGHVVPALGGLPWAA